MGGQDLYVQMPTIWPIISTQSVHKAAEASGGFPETEWLSFDNISRRHTDVTPGQGSAATNYTADLSIV